MATRGACVIIVSAAAQACPFLALSPLLWWSQGYGGNGNDGEGGGWGVGATAATVATVTKATKLVGGRRR